VVEDAGDDEVGAEVLRAVEGGTRGGRLAGLRQTEGGVRFEQALLRGGCVVWLFLGVIVPFMTLVYPGGSPMGAPRWGILAAAVVGWVWLAMDVTRKVVVRAEPGLLVVETRVLGISRRRAVVMDGAGLVVYVAKRSSGGMMSAYGLRPACGGRGLGVYLERREAEVLAAVLEKAVWPRREDRPVQRPRLAEE
jgi:hypothetical protein